MKISRTHKQVEIASSKKIMAADLESIGTTYYRISSDQILKAYSAKTEDPFIYYAIAEDGLAAINLDTLVGSQIVDDELYICQSDGQNIIVDNTEVDPFVALEEYGVEACENYIEDVDSKFILDTITIYEIDRKSIIAHLNDAAADALDREYDFTTLVRYYNEDIQ